MTSHTDPRHAAADTRPRHGDRYPPRVFDPMGQRVRSMPAHGTDWQGPAMITAGIFVLLLLVLALF